MKDQDSQMNSDLEARSLESKVSSLERQVAEQQDQLRDYEKSLVERIADVDDDRRANAAQLQRAWRSQGEELSKLLGRQWVIVAGTMVLFLSLMGVVLFFVYHQGNSERQLLADHLTELKQELARTSEKPADTDSLRAELTRVSAAVNEISASLDRKDETQADSTNTILEDERRARDEADAAIGAKVQSLESKLESLKREFDTLRESKENARATKAASGHDLPEDSPPENAKQEPAAATVAPPLESRHISAAKGMHSPEEAPVATAEQTLGDAPEKVVPEANQAAETQKTLVIANDTYALQLIGFYGFHKLLNFIRRKDLPQQLYYIKDTVKGRPWFALIHSLHKNYASAKAQLRKLPPELVEIDPWIRPIGAGVELTVLER